MSPANRAKSSARAERAVGGIAAASIAVLFVLSFLANGVPAGHARPTIAAAIPMNGLNCGDGRWSTTHLLVWGSGCQALFGVEYAQDFNNWNSNTSFNFSFAIENVAEITPGGHLVRLANLMVPFAGSTSASNRSGGVDISMTESTNVTSATGNWTPAASGWGAGSLTQWSVNSSVAGTANFSAVFHLENPTGNLPANGSTNQSYAVKFDLGVAGWPWVSSADSLGIVLESLGAGGAHFAYDASTSTLAESWNASGTTFVSLVFGSSATAAYAKAGAHPVRVEEQVALFHAGSKDRQAVTLLTFSGSAGNYSNLSYDPWVEFSPSTASGSPAGSNSTLALGVWIASISGISLALVGAAVYMGRTRRLRREGEAIVTRMQRIIDEGPEPPGHR